MGRRARARREAMTARQRHSIKASCASEAVQIELLHPHTGEPLLVRALEGEGRVVVVSTDLLALRPCRARRASGSQFSTFQHARRKREQR